MTPKGPGYVATFRKGGVHPMSIGGGKPVGDKLSMVVFSGDLDKRIAAFIMANGALASVATFMGEAQESRTTLFI